MSSSIGSLNFITIGQPGIRVPRGKKVLNDISAAGVNGIAGQQVHIRGPQKTYQSVADINDTERTNIEKNYRALIGTTVEVTIGTDDPIDCFVWDVNGIQIVPISGASGGLKDGAATWLVYANWVLQADDTTDGTA